MTVAEVTITGALASGDSYGGTWTGSLPAGLSGSYRVYVFADYRDSVFEFGDAAVNLASSSGTVLIAPESYGDLTAVIDAAPSESIIAGQIQVDWTVTNTTDAWSLTPASVWYDRIILSTDTTYGNADDRTLATVRHDGALDPGTSYSAHATVTLPSGSIGSKFLFVASDVNGQVYEFVYETNNVSPGQPLNIVAPDLVTQVSLTATDAQFGDTISFDWTIANEGDGAAVASFRDRVWLSNNATLGGDTLLATVDAVTLPLEPGQQYQRLPFSVSLPLTGLLPEGDYFVIASTDALGNQPESHEDNNTFTAGPIRLAYPDLPDLQVIGLTVVETPPTSGAPMTIRWQTANNGPIASVGSFNERVTVVNTDTGATLLNTIVSYDASTSGSIAAGGFAEREHAITLPEGPAGAGTLLITVITDVNSQIVESYGLDLPETNNEASFSVGSEIRPYPDLIVVDPTLSPSSVELGGEVTVAWKTQNIGTADVETSFTERIQLVNKTTGQTILEQIVTYDPVTDGAIAAGTVKERR